MANLHLVVCTLSTVGPILHLPRKIKKYRAWTHATYHSNYSLNWFAMPVPRSAYQTVQNKQ